MDIVTHGMMGIVLASPFAASEPAAAGAFMLGSVFPDLDAFSRVFGKRAVSILSEVAREAECLGLVSGPIEETCDLVESVFSSNQTRSR